MTDTPSIVPMSFADQVAAVDAIEVANSIVMTGCRGAMHASNIEIIAVAHYALKLTTLATLTFELMSVANIHFEATDPDQRRALRASISQQVSDVAAALEALGYGASSEQTGNTTGEKTNG